MTELIRDGTVETVNGAAWSHTSDLFTIERVR